MKENLLYLLLSVSLSSGRNIVTKKTAVAANDKAQFFLSQTVLFACAAFLLFCFGIGEFLRASALTVSYGIVYGILLILSQWMFTIALKGGNTSVCSVVYSLGFLLPTVSGTLFWHEAFTVLNGIGVLVAVAIIVLTAKHDSSTKNNSSFVPFILAAMVSSGGLGIMQKVQQASAFANEKGAFLLIGFLVAFCCSLVAFLLCQDRRSSMKINLLPPALTGLCFGGANLCNTILAGRMKSAVFFPVQNISTILFTTALGILLFKEKITRKTVGILLLGVGVIILFSL